MNDHQFAIKNSILNKQFGFGFQFDPSGSLDIVRPIKTAHIKIYFHHQ